jgi:hypothetical protein
MTLPMMQPVISSNVAEVGYDAETSTLYVRFKNCILYAYTGVPQLEFQKLIASHSVGSYLSQYIKSTYPCQKIG